MNRADYIREARTQMIEEAVQAFNTNTKEFIFNVDSLSYTELEEFNWHPSLRLAIAEEIVRQDFFENNEPSTMIKEAWEKYAPSWIANNMPPGEGYMVPGGIDIVNYRGGIQIIANNGKSLCKFVFTEDGIETFLKDYIYQTVKTCKSSRYLKSKLDPDFKRQHRFDTLIGRLSWAGDPWIKDIADYAKEKKKEQKNVRY